MRALIATLLITFAVGLTGCASEEGDDAATTEESAPAEDAAAE